MHWAGLSNVKIARYLQKNRRTIDRWIARYYDTDGANGVEGEHLATMAGRLTDCDDAVGSAAFSSVLISTVAVPRIARRLRWRPPRELENGVFSDVVRRSSGTATCSLARLPRLDRAV